MSRAVYSYRPSLALLESRLQPGSVLEGSLNLSLLAGDVGLLSGNLFASLESTALVAEPLAPTPQAKQAAFLQAADIKVREPDLLPFDLSSPVVVRPAASETLQAIQTTMAVQPFHGTDGRRGNCIVNGDFETGDLTGWELADPKDDEVGVDDVAAYTGAYGAYFGTVGTYNAMWQTCETAAKSYTISFFLQNLEGGAPTAFFVTWGDELLLYLENADPFPYQQFVFEYVPTPASQTALVFYDQHDPDYWELDDVVVVAS